ncbi:unnamed protein product [Clonostachys rhizophaga]|uniref:Uncharacterized protein n=1 Tax=Clonostachys rhizophaga TaxID=160324 RepID=A0A9N9YDZ5_9HYPO|nr:unnamed protein product [Clonostachys rhizophaga]
MAGTTDIIGWLTILTFIIHIAYLIRIYILPSRLNRYAHPAPNGDEPWALVTGASDGIGRQFAQELAAQGFNVVLHGRNQAKLSAVEADLQKLHPGRSFKILVADAGAVPCKTCISDKHLSDGGRTVNFDAIRAAVEDLHLTVLINNAGGGPTNPVYAPLIESSAEHIINNVSLNALFPLHLTRVLLPFLNRNGPALLMNISSMADIGFPLLASYSASKQFLVNLTRVLCLEMSLDDRTPQVEVLCVRIGKTTGVSHLKESPSFFTPSSRAMARAALIRNGLKAQT